MICATCEKALVQKTIATKTKKVGGHIIVEAKREALVCECGVRAWDPPARQTPFGYPVYPTPWSGPYAIPLVNPTYPQRFPSIICGTASSSPQGQLAATSSVDVLGRPRAN